VTATEPPVAEVLTCWCCGTTEGVQRSYCGYKMELYGDDTEEDICSECEHQHCMDI
jgi:hypothetical protein